MISVDGEWFFDTELLVIGERVKEVPVKWVEGPDARFPHDIIKMVSQMLRLRFRKLPKRL